MTEEFLKGGICQNQVLSTVERNADENRWTGGRSAFQLLSIISVELVAAENVAAHSQGKIKDAASRIRYWTDIYTC